MVAVLVLRDNTPRHSRVGGNPLNTTAAPCRLGKAERAQHPDASIPEVCQSTCPNCQTAKSESPHTVFQVAGHTCVECSLGFVGHDVEGGLFYDRCTVMDSRLRGNDGGE